MPDAFPILRDFAGAGFMREQVPMGGSWFDGQAMGAFVLVPARMDDFRGHMVHRQSEGMGAWRPVAPVKTDCVVIGFCSQGGKALAALPDGWFFDEFANARAAVCAFCTWLANRFANAPRDGFSAAVDPSLPDRLANGDVPAFMMVQHRRVLMRLAAAHGAVMGKTHDLRVLYRSIDKREAKARLDALANPTQPQAQMQAQMQAQTQVLP